MKPLRLSNYLVWLVLFGLVSLWGVGQADSLSGKRGTLYIARPEVKPKVEVQMKYEFLGGHLRTKKKRSGAVAFANDELNTRTNGGIFPEPYAVNVENADNFRRFDAGSDILYFDMDSFFSQHMGVTYAWADLPKSDTVVLELSIDKRGNPVYYGQGKEPWPLVKKKCFETITLIKSWKPARTVLYTGDGRKIRRSRKIASKVRLTIILTAGWDQEVEN